MYEGPTIMRICAVKLSNLFWKETLLILARLSSDITFYRPDFFYILNIFDNDPFKYGDNTIKKYNFHMIWFKNVRQPT